MRTLAETHQLQPGDVLISPKSLFGIIKHSIVFCGYDQYGTDLYLENNPLNGVQWLAGVDIFEQYNIIAIRKFGGDETERALAIQRAESLVGAKYDLLKFNCEHFTNFVQTGMSFSKQSDAGKGLAALGISLLILSKI
jgi:hypothetical protein